jgi:hypothetical protein
MRGFVQGGILALGVVLATTAFSRVLDLHSDIRVAKNGELTVTERITVETQEGAFALVRDLPGNARIVEVIRDGHPASYVVEGRHLRISGAVPQGRHLYQISYRASRHVHFLGGLDELRWTVKGSGFPVERLTAEVTLPARVPPRDIRTEASVPDHQSFVRDGRAAFRITRPLASQESMTIVVRFPKDVVEAPGIGQRARWLLADYGGLLFVLAGLGATAAVLRRFKTLSAKT